MAYTMMAEIAQYLQLPEAEGKINELAELSEGGQFFLTFWGHYSAGKSRLINTLLQRDLLPVHVKETTAALTYIHYGEQERAVLFLEDGSQQEITLPEVKALYQGNSELLQRLERMEISLPESLLKNGLVIVDTPGVNTILQRHQDLALAAIQSAGRIIYCLGGSPSKVDEGFIRMIHEGGIQITFVRTKCDLINPQEEDPHEAVAAELNSLANILKVPVGSLDFYAVSVEESCQDWYRNIEIFRNYLLKLANNAKIELEKSCQDRLSKYQVQFMSLLQERLKNYQDVLQGNGEKQREKIAECQHQIERLQASLDKKKEKIHAQVQQSESEILAQTAKITDRKVNQFSQAVNRIDSTDDFQQQIPSLGKQYLRNAIDETHELLNLRFEKIVADTSNAFADADMIAVGMDQELPPTYEEIEADNTAVLQDYRQQLQEARDMLTALQEERSRNSAAYQELQEQYSKDDIDAAISELNQQLDTIPKTPITRYIPGEQSGIGKVLHGIGKVGDLALLFAPIGALSKVGKAAGLAGKIGKLTKGAGAVSSIIKTAGVAGKLAKIPLAGSMLPVLSAGKKVFQAAGGARTAGKLLQAAGIGQKASRIQQLKRAAAQAAIYGSKAAQTRQQMQDNAENQKDRSLFDVFTLEYWFDKAGHQFDTPPKLVIDEEKEAQRQQAIADLENEINQQITEKVERRKELGLLKSKEELAAFREQEQRRAIQMQESQLQERMAEQKRRARKQSLDKYRDDYADYLQRIISATLNQMVEQQCQAVGENMDFYIMQRTARLQQNLALQQQTLEDIQASQKEGKEEIQNRITECQKYLEYLKENHE